MDPSEMNDWISRMPRGTSWMVQLAMDEYLKSSLIPSQGPLDLRSLLRPLSKMSKEALEYIPDQLILTTPRPLVPLAVDHPFEHAPSTTIARRIAAGLLSPDDLEALEYMDEAAPAPVETVAAPIIDQPQDTQALANEPEVPSKKDDPEEDNAPPPTPEDEEIEPEVRYDGEPAEEDRQPIFLIPSTLQDAAPVDQAYPTSIASGSSGSSINSGASRDSQATFFATTRSSSSSTLRDGPAIIVAYDKVETTRVEPAPVCDDPAEDAETHTINGVALQAPDDNESGVRGEDELTAEELSQGLSTPRCLTPHAHDGLMMTPSPKYLTPRATASRSDTASVFSGRSSNSGWSRSRLLSGLKGIPKKSSFLFQSASTASNMNLSPPTSPDASSSLVVTPIPAVESPYSLASELPSVSESGAQGPAKKLSFLSQRTTHNLTPPTSPFAVSAFASNLPAAAESTCSLASAFSPLSDKGKAPIRKSFAHFKPSSIIRPSSHAGSSLIASSPIASASTSSLASAFNPISDESNKKSLGDSPKKKQKHFFPGRSKFFTNLRGLVGGKSSPSFATKQ
ncbi:hypothetical protein ONZ45_g5215 [Pleurotus djamor]|nr:hypothetical protein ONZ45_g5215 [Pleurotus djamor]